MVKPLFIIGLPKTGTTLLQRVLASHPNISSSSELWVLLPPLAALQPGVVVADYGARSCCTALHRMLDNLPNGRADYLRAVEALGNQVYTDLSDPGATYFVDKTPRYHLVIKDLVDTFPEARFLFLWRNPLSVISSTILHNRDRLVGMRFAEFDLLRGYTNLSLGEACAAERGMSIRYEDFVSDPESELRRAMEFLELDLHPGQLADFAKTQFPGGDQNGLERLTIGTTSLERWRNVLNRPARRFYGLRLLTKMDETTLKAHGYDKQALISALSQQSAHWSFVNLLEFANLAAASVYIRIQGQAIRTGRRDALLY